MTKTTTTTKDPICGMDVDQASSLHVERDGKTFFFCSDHCRQKFLSNSETTKGEEKPKDGCCSYFG
jgi:Cu+-exporting ATPase